MKSFKLNQSVDNNCIDDRFMCNLWNDDGAQHVYYKIIISYMIQQLNWIVILPE